jgi:TonB family protein
MTTYILKTILCSAILFVFYYLILEREKTYRFNRFYLLFSIVIAFIIPLITIKTIKPESAIPEIVYQQIRNFQGAISPQFISPAENSTQVNYILFVYLAVTLFLLTRFLINVYTLFKKVRKNVSVPYNGAKLVLTTDMHVPHSFLNYIFIYKEDFEKGKVEKEIFSHELAHISQQHSLDVLFIELITVFAWINPLLFLYKKSIQLNHEFLADDFVLRTSSSPRDYQYLLLDKAMQPSVLVLSSSFNYLQTKKRIIMMTKKTSFRTAILKEIAVIPLIIITGFLFSTKVIAQDSKKTAQKQTPIEIQIQSPEDDPSFKHDAHSLSMGFSSWVANQIKYPSESLKNKVKGWVHVGYTVELDGTISDVRVLSAPDPVLGEAVAKAVKNSPRWLAGKNTKNKSPFKSAVSIKFEIPEKVISSEDIPVFACGKVPMYEELTPGIELDRMPQFSLAKAATDEANEEAIRSWVEHNSKYPEKAFNGKIEGWVMVRFIVTRNGKLEDFLVTRSASPELDNEAIRVLSIMPDWKPAMKGGEPQNVYYHAEVVFKLAN